MLPLPFEAALRVDEITILSMLMGQRDTPFQQ